MSFYTFILVAAFLFITGSMLGWLIEVLFRRFFTAKKWINPGFLTGPYLPLYGFGVAALFALSFLPIKTGYGWLDAVLVILIMGCAMTLVEYIAGLIFIKGLKIKLWDYSDRKGNIQGIICPLFSFLWLLVSVFYYFVINPYVIDAVVWFVNHIEFSFIVGLFFGVFIVDLGHSVNLSAKIFKFAKSHNIVVSFEKLKESVYDVLERFEHKRASFVFPFRSPRQLEEHLETYERENTSPAQTNEEADGSGT